MVRAEKEEQRNGETHDRHRRWCRNRLLAQYGGKRSRTNLSCLLKSDHTYKVCLE